MPAAAEATTAAAASGALKTLSDTADAVEAAASLTEETAPATVLTVESPAEGGEILTFFFFFKRPTDNISTKDIILSNQTRTNSDCGLDVIHDLLMLV